MGDTLLFENLSFVLPPNAIVGIVGPNGAGKTTLFKLIAGIEQPDSGTLTLGETVKLAFVDQTRSTLTPGKTVFDIISRGQEVVKLGTKDIHARAYCSRFNFTGADQQKLVDVLSGGERNRVHLACLLQEGANIILLDEPTNDLDVNTLQALESAIDNFAGCALIISHDRWFLDRIATHILAFEGDSHVEFFEGSYSEYEEDRRRRFGHDAHNPRPIKFRKLTR